MSVYMQILDGIVHSKKSVMAGQMSLFDIVTEEQKQELEIKMPNVGEYDKELILSFEKEVLGFYVSGHPMQEYQKLWEKHITAKTSDFYLDEENNHIHLADGERKTIGGMIVDKKIKYTKQEKIMAFVTLEDLVGNVEVIVFPQCYEKFSSKLIEDNKVFMEGRVALEEERDGKLICEKVIAFDEYPKKLWIKFKNLDDFVKKEQLLYGAILEYEGKDTITIYIEETRQMKQLPANKNVNAGDELLSKLRNLFGEDNIKLV